MSEGINSMDWAIQQPILQSQVNKTNFLDIAVVFPDGKQDILVEQPINWG